MADGLPRVQGRAITAPGSIQNAGAGDAAAASMFNRVAQSALQIGKALEPMEIKQGEEDARKDWLELEKENEGRGPGNVTKRSGFLGLTTAGDVAYNNMMETLYLQKTQAALLEKAQELQNRTETFGDVDAFDADFSKFVEGYGGGLDPEFADEFFLEAEKIQQGTRLKIAQAKQAADQKEAIATMDTVLSNLENEILAAEQAGSLVGESGRTLDQLYTDYALQSAEKTNNPLYQYSEVQAQRDFKDFKVRAMAAGMTPEIRDVFLIDGYAAALQWADDQATGLGLPPAETSSIRNALRNEVNLMRQNQAALEAERKEIDEAARKAREAAADEADMRVTDAWLNDLPKEEIRRRLDIFRNLTDDPARYSTLANKVMDSKESEPMPANLFATFLSAADRGELTEAQIWNLPGDSTQLKTLLDRSNQWQDDAVRAGKDTLNAYFAKADALIGSMDPNDYDKGQLLKVDQAAAHNELQSWIEEQTVDGKRPRRQEIVDEAQKIAVRYGRASGVAANSRYLKVDYNGNIDPASVSAARDALAADLKDGHISQEDARKELAKIKLAEEGMKNAR